MRRLGWILVVGVAAGTLMYLVAVLGAVLHSVLPLYLWGIAMLLGVIVATLVDVLGPAE